MRAAPRASIHGARGRGHPFSTAGVVPGRIHESGNEASGACRLTPVRARRVRLPYRFGVYGMTPGSPPSRFYKTCEDPVAALESTALRAPSPATLACWLPQPARADGRVEIPESTGLSQPPRHMRRGHYRPAGGHAARKAALVNPDAGLHAQPGRTSNLEVRGQTRKPGQTSDGNAGKPATGRADPGLYDRWEPQPTSMDAPVWCPYRRNAFRPEGC